MVEKYFIRDDVKGFVVDIANAFVKMDAELNCEYCEKFPRFGFDANERGGALYSNELDVYIPLKDNTTLGIAAEIANYALSVDADAYVAEHMDGEKRKDLVRRYDDAVELSATLLGIAMAISLVGAAGLIDLVQGYIDTEHGEVFKTNRLFFRDGESVEIILPYPYKFRGAMHSDFFLEPLRKVDCELIKETAAIAVGRYLVSDDRHNVILKQLAKNNEDTPMPILFAAQKWIREYLGALMTALSTAERHKENQTKDGEAT